MSNNIYLTLLPTVRSTNHAATQDKWPAPFSILHLLILISNWASAARRTGTWDCRGVGCSGLCWLGLGFGLGLGRGLGLGWSELRLSAYENCALVRGTEEVPLV